MVFSSGLIRDNMRDNGVMEIKMGVEFIPKKMGSEEKDNGLMAIL